MAVNYTWDCKTVDIHPQENDLTDVVYNIHWKLTGKEGEHEVEAIGTVAVALDPETPFIPFEDLTNEIIVGWTKEAMGEEQVQAIEDSVASQIAELENPTSVTMTIGD